MKKSEPLNKTSKYSSIIVLTFYFRINKLKSIKEMAEVDLKEFRLVQGSRYDESVKKMQEEMAKDSSSSAAQAKQAEEIK